MKRLTLKTLFAITSAMLTLAVLSTYYHSTTPQQIYTWVARQMNIEDVGNMPEIKYVSKERLQQVLLEFSYKSYSQMETLFGKDNAEEIIGSHMDNIVGLFHSQTKTIYIGAFLNPCRRKAVLAHEFVHYFQDVKGGRIHPHDYAANYKQSRREIEAYNIESRFTQAFCNQD